MKKQFCIILLLNLFYSVTVNSSIIQKQPIEKYIKKSDLIVRGEVIQKYSNYETHWLEDVIMNNGVLSKELKEVNSIYTTYVIVVEEVLHGSYEKKTIEVKMLGGCDNKGVCLQLSSNYDFNLKKDVLLLLNYDETNDIYRSTSNGITAYLVHKDGLLESAGDFVVLDDDYKIINEKIKDNNLTIEKLKSKIQGVKSEK